MLKRMLPYVGPLIGLIGVSLGLYFHAQSVQDRRPVFYVGPRATIVDSAVATPSPLQVLYEGRPVGNTDVVELVLCFWNAGKLPIKAEDVLEPVAIKLVSGEILESRVLHISRSVTKFEIHPVSESSKNVLPISFGILEHDDGAAIQIIYAGKSDTVITVNGTIVGAGAPRFFSEGPRTHNPEEVRERYERVQHDLPQIAYLLTVAIFLTLIVYVRQLRRPDEQSRTGWARKRRLAMIVFLAVSILAYLGLDADMYFETHRPGVPYSVLGH